MTHTASVIIPAHNAGHMIDRCLRALDRQTVHPLEIIVVDDGSTDNTADVARLAGASVLSQPARGAAAARNLGARHAAGDVLLFTDADCEPADTWVEMMLIPFDDPSIAGVKGTYCTHQRELTARFVQLEYEDKYRRMARLPQIDFIDTYSAGYRRDIFLAHGGFDESFPRANVEDQEFSFRLAASGHKMVFQPAAVVGHRHAAHPVSYLRKKFWIGYWKVKVHLRHPARALSDSHTPPVLKLQILLLAGTIAGGGFGLMKAGGWIIALTSLVALLASMVPFIAWAWRKDRQVALVAPLYLAGRAGALGMGLATGILAQIIQRLRRAR